MRTRLSKVMGAAAILLLAAAFGAFAAPVGQQVAVTSDIAAFFSARGVDPQYLGKADSAVPAAQLALINRIVATPDDTLNATYDHSTLVSLVLGALDAAAVQDYVPYYMEIGSNVWTVELGSNYLAGTTTANPQYIPL